jgi:hypothetical protein
LIVQVINMDVPEGKQATVHELIVQKYLPILRDYTGFLSADIQVSRKNDNVNVLLFWKSGEDLETFQKEGGLAGAALQLAAYLPGLRVRQRGYTIGAY